MKQQLRAGAVALAVAGAGAGAAAVSAQEAPPTVAIAIGKSTMTVTGADALQTGPTRFVVRASGRGERGFVLFRLKPGVSREQAVRATPRIQEPADARRYGTFVASGFVQGRATYTTTVALSPGRYVLIDFSERPMVRGGFRVGPEPSSAAAPVPAATIGLGDHKFTGPDTLPRSGTVRIVNEGKVLHHALVFPLRDGVKVGDVLAQIRRGKEPRTAFAGPPTALVEIVSPKTVNDVEVKLRPGRNLLLCFLQDTRRSKPHVNLGMAKVVTVE